MIWTRVDKEMPPGHLVVLGATLESFNRQAVRLVLWTGQEWQYAQSGIGLSRYAHRVTHWMLLPRPPAMDE